MIDEKKQSSALIFIFITLLIDCIGIGLIIPVMPRLIENLTGADLSTASQYGGWLMFSYAIMQFIFAPILGSMSDHFGRRPVLLFSLLGMGIDYILLSYAPTIGWLFIGRLVSGICGASFTTATAYIADISTPEKRAQNFGLVGAAFGLGFIIGPVVGGLFSQFGPRVPFMIAAGLSLLNFLYGYLLLPESLPAEERREFDWKRANPAGSLSHLKRFPAIMGLIIATFLIYVAGHAAQSTWTFYTIEKFNWNDTWIGYSLGFVGLMIAIVQGGLIRIVIPKIGEKWAVYLGLAFEILALVLFAFASKGWMMFAFMVPYGLGGIAGAAIQGIISNQVPSNEQGELQGGLTSLMSVTSIIGPLLMTYLFSYFTEKGAPVYFPGAPFIMAAILTVFALLYCMKSLRKLNS